MPRRDEARYVFSGIRFMPIAVLLVIGRRAGS